MCTKFHKCVPNSTNVYQNSTLTFPSVIDWNTSIVKIAKITEIAKIDNIAKIGNIGVRGLTLNAERLILLKGYAGFMLTLTEANIDQSILLVACTATDYAGNFTKIHPLWWYGKKKHL